MIAKVKESISSFKKKKLLLKRPIRVFLVLNSNNTDRKRSI